MVVLERTHCSSDLFFVTNVSVGLFETSKLPEDLTLSSVTLDLVSSRLTDLTVPSVSSFSPSL